MGGEWCLGKGLPGFGDGCRQRICDYRFHDGTGSPTQRWSAKKGGKDQAIGRGQRGPSTKIHALVDALGNPLAFHLTQGQIHDVEGADILLPQLIADTLLGDKAYDADERVIRPLSLAGKTAVIPSRQQRKTLRDYDKATYRARHLIENFFCRLKQFRGIATRYDKTARNFLAAVQLVAAVIWLN